MGQSLNKVMLIGRVGDDPDIRATSSGTRFAKMSLATNEQWKDRSGEQKEKTEWHRLQVWGSSTGGSSLLDVFERYVKKGDLIYVEGSLEYSESETDGQKKYWTNIRVRQMQMLGSPGAGDQGGGGRGGGFQGDSSPAPAPAPPISEPDDDLPF